MKAVDTNILVYAHREECVQHEKAKSLLTDLVMGPQPWALPWPCLYEFLRAVTHAKGYKPPTTIEMAWGNIEELCASPSLVLLHETERHREVLKQLVLKTKISGNLIHDAHIAALLIEHGVREILTADDDFRRFDELTVTDPFRAAKGK